MKCFRGTVRSLYLLGLTCRVTRLDVSDEPFDVNDPANPLFEAAMLHAILDDTRPEEMHFEAYLSPNFATSDFLDAWCATRSPPIKSLSLHLHLKSDDSEDNQYLEGILVSSSSFRESPVELMYAARVVDLLTGRSAHRGRI